MPSPVGNADPSAAIARMQQGAMQTLQMQEAATQTGNQMAQGGMAASNAASQMNEMMNMQAMVNNMRKAASELVKGAV